MRRVLTGLHILCLVFLSIALAFTSYALTSMKIDTINSGSLLDLIVNNVTNIFIALYISGYIVRKYESRQHSLDFLVNLLQQTNDLCESLLSYSKHDMRLNRSKYLRQVNLLIEYSEAILTQLKCCCKRKVTMRMAQKMICRSQKLYEKVSCNDPNDYDDIIESVISIQTRIPQMMSEIKY